MFRKWYSDNKVLTTVSAILVVVATVLTLLYINPSELFKKTPELQDELVPDKEASLGDCGISQSQTDEQQRPGSIYYEPLDARISCIEGQTGRQIIVVVTPPTFGAVMADDIITGVGVSLSGRAEIQEIKALSELNDFIFDNQYKPLRLRVSRGGENLILGPIYSNTINAE